MPSKVVSEHFATYTENNRIKHAILTKYLSAYLQALSKTAAAFHYIDGFAGRGNYAGEPGSPIRAIELLSEQSLPYSISLVEADLGEVEELRKAVLSCPPSSGLFDAPLIEPGEFSSLLTRILARPIYGKYRNTATFAFVDPCRVSGYGAVDLGAILKKPYGECLVFWNYEGINRWLGAVAAQSNDGSRLSHLFGSESGLLVALEIWRSARNVAEKEHLLLAHFLRCTNELSGAKYLVPFRFIAESANRTGHYLIHFSSSSLAFKIMKDVMASLSSSAEPGQFVFLGDSDIGGQLPMFVPEAESMTVAAIKAALSDGSRPVKLFTEQWVLRPDDYFRLADYKRILLSMEAAGIIEVLGKDGALAPPGSRRTSRSLPTLSDKLFVRLVTLSK